MQLYLLRHGEAQNNPAVPDQDRALTSEGRATIQQTARVLRQMELELDAVYSSPLLRARETAELAIGLLTNPLPIAVTELLCNGADYADLLRLLHKHPPASKVLLVGHNPHLARLISFLVCDTEQALVEMKKGSLCLLSSNGPLQPGRVELRFLLPPHLQQLIVGRG